MRRAIAARKAAVLLPRVAVDHAAGVAVAAVAVAVAGVEDVGKQEIEDDDKDQGLITPLRSASYVGQADD